MIGAKSFIAAANDRGIDFITGVPCSFLSPLINRAISDKRQRYVGAACEGSAAAIAAGAWLAGRMPMVMCQNSGLGNLVNPLTSLQDPFKIPSLLVVTWRGEPGLKDEPQHRLMGEITHTVLGTMRIPVRPFPKQDEEIDAALDAAFDYFGENQLPFGLVMEKGSVADEPLDDPVMPVTGLGAYADTATGGERPTRAMVLEALQGLFPAEAGVIATTGKCGRELFTLDDRDQQIYLVGSMGGASGVGLGVAVNTSHPVVVLDGDGAALMKLGILATVAAYKPKNYIHVILDNGVHDSTGGQATVSGHVDFARIAAACGYLNTVHTDSLDGAVSAFRLCLEIPGPHLLHVRIAPGSMKPLGRPKVPPPEVARRFKAHMT